jgi:catecholate siderophore receptor
LRDLPQTISVISQAVIQQQGATTLRDVLRNVPGLTMTAGEGGTPSGDNLTLRGFSARNDIFVDGVRDLSPQSRDPFNMEQVEITKGPTSAVSGRGSAGGTINLVSKGANLSKSLGGSLAIGNADARRAAIDVNTPLKMLGLGERTAFRLNLLWHESGVAGRDIVKNDRWGIAPSLAFGLGTPTRFTFSYYKLKQNNISDYGIPWVPVTNNALVAYRDQPAPVARNTFYGYANRDREVLNQDAGTFKFEHDVSDNFLFRNQLRFSKSGRDSVATPPRFADVNSTVINRELRSWVAKDKIWDNQTDLRFNFQTGKVSHALVTGLSLTHENNIRINRTAPNATTTLLNPNPYDTYPGVVTLSPFIGDITGDTQAGFVADTAKLGRLWEASGSLRWERFAVAGVNTTPLPVIQNVKMLSGRAGLVFKPVQPVSVYASYGTSLSPSLEGLSYGTANTSIDPEKTYTEEVGVKWDAIGTRLLFSGALFRVAKDNARTPGILPTDPPQVLAGRQVSKGVEVSASGGITRSLRVLAAYTYINGKIQSSNNPLEVGKFFINTPQNSASLWATYTNRKFMIGAGPRFTGKRYGNNINTRFVKSYSTVDVMGSYSIHAKLNLRLNITNLSDEYYFDRLGGGHLIPGQARTALLTMDFHF